MKYVRYLFVFVPLAFVAEFVLHHDVLIFLFCCAGMVPLAGLMGEATEELAIHTGPKIGGLLNASLGNAAELIITIVALRAGKIELAKASITGSILGNLLLIMGLSMFLGGLRNGPQQFDRKAAGIASSLMTLAAIGLIVPSLFEILHEVHIGQVDVYRTEVSDPALNQLSVGVAVVLIVLYLLSLVFSFQKGDKPLVVGVDDHTAEEGHHQARWSVGFSLGMLAISTLGIVFLSEFLVGAVEPVVHALGVREAFLGIIVIPLVGNVAEHVVAVQVAYKNKMDLSMAISLGSSMQIALLVGPLLVLLSVFFPKPMTLFFTPFEVALLTLSVITATIIAQDGESNWFEGIQLLAVYVIAGMGFFFTGP